MAKIPGVTTPGEVDIPKENGVVGDASQQKKGVVLNSYIWPCHEISNNLTF